MKKGGLEGIVKATKITLAAMAVTVAIPMWLFGAEPQIMYGNPYYPMDTQNVSLEQYVKAVEGRYGNNFGVKVLSVIAYPGMEFGVWVHNTFFIYKKPKQPVI